MGLLPEPVPGLVPVGRLDADRRGLLLLSTDGDLAHRLTHPRYGVAKRYRVVLGRGLSDADIERLLEGVELEDGLARPLGVRRPSPERADLIEVTMGEGRKREIRRDLRAKLAKIADEMLAANGVFVIPDILANAGGVTVSYFEWVQDRQGFFWNEDLVNQRLEEIMVENFGRVVDYAARHGVDNRIAAYMLALDRVAFAIKLRGIYA